MVVQSVWRSESGGALGPAATYSVR